MPEFAKEQMLQIVNEQAKKYGVPDSVWLPILYTENEMLNSNAVTKSESENSVGLFQINTKVHNYNESDLKDPKFNSNVAMRDFISPAYNYLKEKYPDLSNKAIATGVYSGIDPVTGQYFSSSLGGIRPLWSTETKTRWETNYDKYSNDVVNDVYTGFNQALLNGEQPINTDELTFFQAFIRVLAYVLILLIILVLLTIMLSRATGTVKDFTDLIPEIKQDKEDIITNVVGGNKREIKENRDIQRELRKYKEKLKELDNRNKNKEMEKEKEKIIKDIKNLETNINLENEKSLNEDKKVLESLKENKQKLTKKIENDNIKSLVINKEKFLDLEKKYRKYYDLPTYVRKTKEDKK